MSSKQDDTRASRVPMFAFSPIRGAQEEELAVNPMVLRFRESRAALSADPFRPSYHFVSPESTMNDPNGLCYRQGLWHLFYQGYPPEDPRQHWGHAVSRDLIHWRDLPYAIYPDPERCCFSGATLVEEDRVIAMYHGTEAGNMVAVSSDPLLLTWEKLTGAPVIPNADDAPYRVFDPCIWKKDGVYFSLSAGYTYHEPSGRRLRADFLFRSTDLVNWEYLHPFVEEDVFGLPGDDGACPYFWPIGNRHMLLHFSHMSGGKYILGDYDTERDVLIAAAGGRFNFGAFGPGGIHAPSATPDGEGGIIVIFNMNAAKPSHGWNQIMSLPRRLTLEDAETIQVEPAGDVESLRRSHVHLEERTLPANEEVLLDSLGGRAIEIIACIDAAGSSSVELSVLRSPNGEERTRIIVYPQRGFRDWRRYAGWQTEAFRAAQDSIVCLDTTGSSLSPDVQSRPPECAPVYIAPQEPIEMRIFVDHSVVEVFVNGRQCVAARVYPSRSDSTGVSLASRGSDSRLERLDFWQLDTIYA